MLINRANDSPPTRLACPMRWQALVVYNLAL
jgi:hypothetical protein